MAQQAHLRRTRRAATAHIDKMPLEAPEPGGDVAADEIALVPHPGGGGHFPELPPLPELLPPSNDGGGPIPSFPVLTEEVGYPPSPLAGGSTAATSRPGSSPAGGFGGAGRGGLGPMVTRALQDVLGDRKSVV